MRAIVVTTINEPYYPGLVALHNSWRRNSPEQDFACLVFGSDDLVKRVEARGIRVIANPTFPIVDLPLGKHHRNPDDMPAMYGRLLIPDLFPEYPRSVFIDADAIILKPLSGLVDMAMTRPVAATRCNGPIAYNVIGRTYPFEYGPMTSFMLIDHALWDAAEIGRKWVEAALDPTLGHPFTVQSVLQAAIENDWHCLPWEWQPHAGHETYINNRDAALVLHFMGTNPWQPMHPNGIREYQIPARAKWGEYAE